MGAALPGLRLLAATYDLTLGLFSIRHHRLRRLWRTQLGSEAELRHSRDKQAGRPCVKRKPERLRPGQASCWASWAKDPTWLPRSASCTPPGGSGPAPPPLRLPASQPLRRVRAPDPGWRGHSGLVTRRGAQCSHRHPKFVVISYRLENCTRKLYIK